MKDHSDRGLGIWFRDQIEDALMAVDMANLEVARHIDTPEMRLYRLGYEAAIQAVAAVFGIRYAARTTEAVTIGLIAQAVEQLPGPSQQSV